ncbi:MAG: hypothetical protein J5867_05295 [Prevotella sp.]|nr:hypothetical protein [Prevotella sp.]
MMKIRSLLLSALCGMMVMAGFTSCSSDDEDMPWNEGAKIELPKYRAFVLAEGSYGKNNSHLFYVDPMQDTTYVNDIYTAQNGVGLGDTANDMLTYDGDIYVVVNVSKVLLRLNGAGVEKARYEKFEELGEPRYAVATDGKLYVTCYGGYVARFDAKTLAFEASVPVDANPEEIIVYDGKLYCVNSGWGYGNTISVIDVKKFDKAESIVTLTNPLGIQESEGHFYILTGGVYNYSTYAYDEMPCCGEFNPVTKGTSKIGDATKMMAYGGNLYYVNATSPDWVNYTTTFSQYDPAAGRPTTWTLKNMPSELPSSIIYMMARNPYDGSFYIATTDYVHDGTLYHFDADFSYMFKSFTIAGINPNSMVFLK